MADTTETAAPTASTSRRNPPPPLRTALTGASVALAVIAAGPFLFDTYTTNILIRALFLAALAMTVDVLWGYTGILTFGQSAFFGIGGLCPAR